MAALTWTQTALVKADPDAVFGWMTDYSEHDHGSEAFRAATGAKPGAAKRKVVSRSGNTVVLEDSWGGRTFRNTVTLDPARRSVRIEGGFGYRAEWRAIAERGGTRVAVEGSMDPGGVFGLLLPLFGKKMREENEKDFRGHIAEMEQDLARGR